MTNNIENYYIENKLSEKGISYDSFEKACIVQFDSNYDVDPEYVLYNVASKLLTKLINESNDTRITVISKDLYQPDINYKLIALKGVIKSISQLYTYNNTSYKILILADESGQITVSLASEWATTYLDQHNIQVGDSILVEGTFSLTKYRTPRITRITKFEKIGETIAYKNYTALNDLLLNLKQDILVKVVKIFLSKTKKPSFILVEDQKKLMLIKVWAANMLTDIVENQVYSIKNVLYYENKKAFVTKTKTNLELIFTETTTLELIDSKMHTYLSDNYLTSLEGTFFNNIYNLELELTSVSELSYTKYNEESPTIVNKYLFKLEDDTELVYVDWSNEYPDLKDNLQKSIKLEYVTYSSYKSNLQLAKTIFTKFIF